MYKNQVILIGNLTRTPEIKFIENDKSMINLSIAINNVYYNQANEKVESVEFVSVLVFGKTAENCAKYLVKGQKVFIEGRIKNRVEQTAEGNRYHTGIVANEVQFGSKPNNTDEKLSVEDQKTKAEVEPKGLTTEDLDYGDEVNVDDIPF